MTRAYKVMKQRLLGTVILSHGSSPAINGQASPVHHVQEFSEVLGEECALSCYLPCLGSGNQRTPSLHSFFFYQCLQFDTRDATCWASRLCSERAVEPPIVVISRYYLKNGYRWTKIGETTAWNWQQGARLQWRPR